MGANMTKVVENRDFSVTIVNDCELETMALGRSSATAIVLEDMSFENNESAIDAAKAAEVIIPYECINGKCDFAKAIVATAASNELNEFSVKQYVQIIVEVIAENPSFFPNESISGYVIRDTIRRNILLLENKTKGIQVNKPKYGIVDLGFNRISVKYAAKPH